MTQKLPEKIYVGTRKSELSGDVITTVDKDWPNAQAYINKEAMIDKLYKWFEEDTTVADYYSKDAFVEVVDKLFNLGRTNRG